MDDPFLLKFAESGLTSEEQFKLGVLLKMEMSLIKRIMLDDEGKVTTTFKLVEDWRNEKKRVGNFSAMCDELKRACQDMKRTDLAEIVQNEYLSERLRKEREGTMSCRKKFNEQMLLTKKELRQKEEELNIMKEQQIAQQEMLQKLQLATPVQSSSSSSLLGMTKDQQRAQEKTHEILPLINEMNAVSGKLNKHRTFEVVLIPPAAQEGGLNCTTDTKVMVKMTDSLTKNTWMWERSTFINRHKLIQDMHKRYISGEDISNIPKVEDPFWMPTQDVLIGTANITLQSLAYAMDFEDRVIVADYNGHEEGYVVIRLAPTTQKGELLGEDDFVDDPAELLNKPYHFKVTIQKAEVFKARFSFGLHVKYRVFKDKAYTYTKKIKGTLTPEFNHSQVFSFPFIQQEHINYFESSYITFLIYGVQEG